MNCVVCQAALVAETHEGIAVDCCPEGHGMWLDEGELRAIVDSEIAARTADEREAAFTGGVAAADPDPDTHEARNCPVCSQPMEKVNYDETSGVIIDTCVGDGVWLDSGELEHIEAWIESNREELAPVRAHLDEQLARMNLEVDQAHAKGKGKGPLSVFASMWHYGRDGSGT
jgi:Zn-finger nucleic acid-binding protein